MKKIAVIIVALFCRLAYADGSSLTEGLVLNGVSEFTELNRSYFVGALYLEEGANTSEAVQALSDTRRVMELRVTAKRWSPRKFSMQWTQLIVANNDENLLARYSEEFIDFNNMARFSLKQGDQLIIDQQANGHVAIFVNGAETASYKRIGSFDMLLNTWIGKRPPSTDFKQEILGNNDYAESLALFEQTTVQADREDIVQQWNADAEEVAVASAASASAVVLAGLESSVPAAASVPVAAAETVEPVVVEETKAADIAEKPPAPVIAVAAPVVDEFELDDDFDIDPEIIKQQREMMMKLYSSSIVKQTLRKVQYPSRAIKRNLEGLVVVEIKLDRSGQIISVERVESTKYGILNKAAMSAVESVDAYPAAPVAIEGDIISVKVPIRFALN